MYLNFGIAKKYGVDPKDIVLLQAIKQNRTECHYDALVSIGAEEMLPVFEERGLVDFVKPKRKTDTPLHLARLTDKSKNILELIGTPEADPDDAVMVDYLCEIYLKQGQRVADQEGGDNKRSLGNKKKVLIYASQFRKLLGLTIHEMYYLCELYVKESVYTMILEKVFFDANKNRYGKFKDNLQDSKLHQFFEDNRGRVISYWKEKIK